MSAPAGRRKRPWWAGSGSIAGTVGCMLVAISPWLASAATSNPNRHPTARLLAIVFTVLVLILLSVNIVGLLRHPQWRPATTRWDKAALPVAVITAVVATAIWLATGSSWPFLIFTAVGFVLLQLGRPSHHRIE